MSSALVRTWRMLAADQRRRPGARRLRRRRRRTTPRRDRGERSPASASATSSSSAQNTGDGSSPSARCSRRPAPSPSSARRSSPASSWPSRRSTRPAACSASTSSRSTRDSGDTSTDIANQSVDRLLGETSTPSSAPRPPACRSRSSTRSPAPASSSSRRPTPRRRSPTTTTTACTSAPRRPTSSRAACSVTSSSRTATPDVGILALQDPYGKGLAENVEKSVDRRRRRGRRDDHLRPEGRRLLAPRSQIRRADPDAIVADRLRGVHEDRPRAGRAGHRPERQDALLRRRQHRQRTGEELRRPGTLDGIKGTLPGAEAAEEFKDQPARGRPGARRTSTTPPSPTTPSIAHRAGRRSPPRATPATPSRRSSIDVTTRRREVHRLRRRASSCSTAGDGHRLRRRQSGPLEFNDNGDPTEATIGIYQYGATTSTPTAGVDRARSRQALSCLRRPRREHRTSVHARSPRPRHGPGAFDRRAGPGVATATRPGEHRARTAEAPPPVERGPVAGRGSTAWVRPWRGCRGRARSPWGR